MSLRAPAPASIGSRQSGHAGSHQERPLHGYPRT